MRLEVHFGGSGECWCSKDTPKKATRCTMKESLKAISAEDDLSFYLPIFNSC